MTRTPIRKLRMSMMLAVAALATAVFPSMASANCPNEPMSLAFQPYGDISEYFLVPGGNFAAPTPGWELKRAKFDASKNALQPGNDAPHLVESKSQSLKMDTGSRVVSPPVCVNAGRPSLRFFAYKKGGATGNLNARLLWTDHAGQSHLTDVGSLSPGLFTDWEISQSFDLASALPIGADETAQVRVVFDFADGSGAKGQWFVDELYVDPHRR